MFSLLLRGFKLSAPPPPPPDTCGVAGFQAIIDTDQVSVSTSCVLTTRINLAAWSWHISYIESDPPDMECISVQTAFLKQVLRQHGYMKN